MKADQVAKQTISKSRSWLSGMYNTSEEALHFASVYEQRIAVYTGT